MEAREDSCPGAGSGWLARFRAGERDIMEECYRDHLCTVERAVGRILTGADRETVVHEVFYRLLSDEQMRATFAGGPLGPWLAAVGRNRAIDFARRHRREQLLEGNLETMEHAAPSWERHVEARLLVEQFRRDHLPAKWQGVFEARFVEGLDQRSAAASLGVSRTTLAYQELRVRHLLKAFLLEGTSPCD